MLYKGTEAPASVLIVKVKTHSRRHFSGKATRDNVRTMLIVQYSPSNYALKDVPVYSKKIDHQYIGNDKIYIKYYRK